MILCERCKNEPPQLQGGWYSEDQWVSCAACDALKDAAAAEPTSLAGFIPNPFGDDHPFKKGGPMVSMPTLKPIVSQGYVSLDLETTGLPWQWCQILEVGAVWDDWDRQLDFLPKFHCYVVHDRIVGEPFALAMNVEILKRIANRDKPENKHNYQFLTPDQVMPALLSWVNAQKCSDAKVIMAGKNYAGFDDRFLGQLPGGEGLNRFHRCVDPGMLWWNPRTDVTPPDTKTCLQRANINTDVKHDAINDALDVIRLIRAAYNVPRF